MRFCDQGPVRDSRNCLRLCHSQSRKDAVLREIVVEGVGGKEESGGEEEERGGRTAFAPDGSCPAY